MVKRGLAVCMVLFLMVALFGCQSTNKRDGKITINALGEDIETYQQAFGPYFEEVSAVDASSFGGGYFVVSGSRYVLLVSDLPEAVTQEQDAIDNAFLIVLYDDGQTVKASITFTSGSKQDNATIENSNIISGVVKATKTYTFTPNETETPVARAELIAAALCEFLKDIEG